MISAAAFITIADLHSLPHHQLTVAVNWFSVPCFCGTRSPLCPGQSFCSIKTCFESGFGSHFAHWPWQYSWPFHCEKKHSIWMSLNTKVKSSPQIIKLCLFGVYSTVKSPVYEVFQFYWTKKNHHVIFFLVNNNQCKFIYTSTRPIQAPTVG